MVGAHAGSGRAPRLVGSALAPAAASAASVFTRAIDGQPERWIIYEAAAGEANRLVVVQDLEGDPPQASFVEAGAPLTVLPDCVAHADSGSVALCPSGPGQFDLGDRADIALITAELPFSLRLRAGAGDDDVFTDSILPSVYGEGGDDRIRLGDRRIAVGAAEGGPGRDVVLGGPYGRRLVGGPDDDLLVNESGIGNVSVAGDEGDDALRLGYVDVQYDFQSFGYGGPGDDVLFVSPPDGPVEPEPEPTPGEPTAYSWWLDGDAGRDVLIGGVTTDTFHGGAGDDVLIARDGHDESVELRRRVRRRLRRPR